MKRFGLIGDVHAEDQLLAAALAYFARERVDGVLCVGDIVDGRGDVDRCVELLEKHNVAVVRGNHDRWLLRYEMRDLPDATSLDSLSEATCRYLGRLPATLHIETVAGRLLLCHGLGKDDMTFVDELTLLRHVAPGRTRLRARAQLGIESDVRIIVAGHTHKRWVGQFGRLTMINAGTLRSDDTPCFAALDLAARAVQFYDFDDSAMVLVSERVEIGR